MRIESFKFHIRKCTPSKGFNLIGKSDKEIIQYYSWLNTNWIWQGGGGYVKQKNHAITFNLKIRPLDKKAERLFTMDTKLRFELKKIIS